MFKFCLIFWRRAAARSEHRALHEVPLLRLAVESRGQRQNNQNSVLRLHDLTHTAPLPPRTSEKC